MTVLWGMVFDSAMHSLTMGICMGLMMGIAFGLFDSDKKARAAYVSGRTARVPCRDNGAAGDVK